jgi:hypothetical protein
MYNKTAGNEFPRREIKEGPNNEKDKLNHEKSKYHIRSNAVGLGLLWAFAWVARGGW